MFCCILTGSTSTIPAPALAIVVSAASAVPDGWTGSSARAERSASSPPTPRALSVLRRQVESIFPASSGRAVRRPASSVSVSWPACRRRCPLPSPMVIVSSSGAARRGVVCRRERDTSLRRRPDSLSALRAQAHCALAGRRPRPLSSTGVVGELVVARAAPKVSFPTAPPVAVVRSPASPVSCRWPPDVLLVLTGAAGDCVFPAPR